MRAQNAELPPTPYFESKKAPSNGMLISEIANVNSFYTTGQKEFAVSEIIKFWFNAKTANVLVNGKSAKMHVPVEFVEHENEPCCLACDTSPPIIYFEVLHSEQPIPLNAKRVFK